MKAYPIYPTLLNKGIKLKPDSHIRLSDKNDVSPKRLNSHLFMLCFLANGYAWIIDRSACLS